MLHGRLLRYLDEVTRAGSIRKASVRLNVASSAINRRIIELEEELGTQIFERLPRGLRLTAAGEVLIQHVRETLREHERTLARLNGLRGLMRGDVTIVTMAGLAANLLAEALEGFREAHPRVKLYVQVVSGERIVQQLVAGEADLGLGYNLANNPRLSTVTELDHRLGAVMAPDHPLATKATIRVADCLAYPIVSAEKGMSLRDAVEMLVPTNSEFAPIMETNSLELMKRMARRAPHLAILNRADIEQEIAAGLLVFVPFGGTRGRQAISLVHRSKGSLDPAASMLGRFIENAMQARSNREVN